MGTVLSAAYIMTKAPHDPGTLCELYCTPMFPAHALEQLQQDDHLLPT